MFCLKVRRTDACQISGRLPGLLFVLISAVIANGQGGVGSTRGLPESAGGSHRIQGTIYLPDGRRAGAGIVIKLDGNVTERGGPPPTARASSRLIRFPPPTTLSPSMGDQIMNRLGSQVVIYGNTGNVGMGYHRRHHEN